MGLPAACGPLAGRAQGLKDGRQAIGLERLALGELGLAAPTTTELAGDQLGQRTGFGAAFEGLAAACDHERNGLAFSAKQRNDVIGTKGRDLARDFAQREIGHRVIIAMLIAAGLSYVMASPFVAVASLSAFLISEFADWAVYSFTRRPFAQRVLLSSLVGTPLDSVVFLAVIGHLSSAGAAAMTASKMVGALVVWWMLRRREATL